ncbi:hypothetical protein RP300_00826 [Oligella urethralis]|nr:hypothetical protein RP300_00826 [Oligella urethralis]
MCLAVENIRFCTCKQELDKEDISIGKWVYKRRAKNYGKERIVGLLICTEEIEKLLNIDKDSEKKYANYFMQLLKDQSVFDFEVNYQLGDTVFITLKNFREIELCYSEEGWGQEKINDPFQPTSRVMGGKIVSSLRFNKSSETAHEK